MDALYSYNKNKAVHYAKKWALSRNPNYADFEKMGGDCTNFASQVVHAGGCPMNYGKYGWHYKNLNTRSAAWTSVQYLYEFVINNNSMGPIAHETDLYHIEIGDLVQIQFQNSNHYGHTLIIVDILPGHRTLDHILIASHSIDRLYYPVSNYNLKEVRLIHINGFKK
ncbi:amidase domain-containing protein [Lutibacter sp. B2]|nr:amidase domain-containing protein [Lutibacter sp. B2]